MIFSEIPNYLFSREQTSGFVYMVWCPGISNEESIHLKIGKTVNMSQRMKQLNSNQSPVEIKFGWCIAVNNRHAVETSIQKSLSNYHDDSMSISSEWFILPRRYIDNLKQIFETLSEQSFVDVPGLTTPERPAITESIPQQSEIAYRRYYSRRNDLPFGLVMMVGLISLFMVFVWIASIVSHNQIRPVQLPNGISFESSDDEPRIEPLPNGQKVAVRHFDSDFGSVNLFSQPGGYGESWLGTINNHSTVVVESQMDDDAGDLWVLISYEGIVYPPSTDPNRTGTQRKIRAYIHIRDLNLPQ